MVQSLRCILLQMHPFLNADQTREIWIVLNGFDRDASPGRAEVKSLTAIKEIIGESAWKEVVLKLHMKIGQED